MATILASVPQLVEATSEPVGWQKALRQAIRDIPTLLAALGLPQTVLGDPELAAAVQSEFPLLVPWEYVARMEPGNPQDPLLRQVLVTSAESVAVEGFGPDPVGDQAAEILPGLLQKYARRALLITTGACAVHCRYCFRRNYPYSAVPKSPAAWEPAIEHIARDESLDEVILSGGDPLMLSDASLLWLVQRLNQIPHLTRLRIHTRVPVVIPQRVCPELLDWLQAARQQVVWVTHINHPHEIDSRLRESLLQLHAHGAVLLNQAVLLRGINDSIDTLDQLSQRLLAARVMPYYLHQLDQVAGAAHFEVAVERGRSLIEQLRARSSGYGVPKYVCELAGDSSKRPC